MGDDGREVSRRGGPYLNTVRRVKKEGTLASSAGITLDGKSRCRVFRFGNIESSAKAIADRNPIKFHFIRDFERVVVTIVSLNGRTLSTLYVQLLSKHW
jgi:hypothetical protein